MYAANIDYHRASSVAEAIRVLQDHEEAKLLAGGHSLIPLLKLRLAAPLTLVDIGRIADLKGIEASNWTVRIGALTTHAEIASSATLKESCPILAEAAAMIGDPQVRNRGTIGGNVAHADPASDLPTVLTALGASFNVTGPGGERTISVSDFFEALLTTALDDHDVITSVDVPASQAGQGMAYSKFFHPASRYAVVGAAAVLTVSGGTCSAASVAVGGLVPTPTRAPSVEGALQGNAVTDDAISEAAGKVSDDVGGEAMGDIYASADYRTAMASVYVGRALKSAAERAG